MGVAGLFVGITSSYLPNSLKAGVLEQTWCKYGAVKMRKKTRRANNEFYIEKRGKGYRAQVSVGKNTRKSVSAKSRALVVAKGRELQKQYAVGINQDITLGEWLNRWLDTYLGNLATNTKYSYRNSVQTHIIPAIGHIRLFELKTIHIREMEHNLYVKSKLAPNSVASVFSALKKALKEAVIAGIAYRNVMANISKPRIEQSKHSILILEQVKPFAESVKESKFKFAYLFMLFGGLRKGEALGVEWNCIDLKAKTLSVKKAVTQTINGVEVGPPKTSKSRRTIPISNFLIEELLKVPSEKRRGYVVKGEGKRPAKPKDLDYNFKLFRKKLDLKITMHELRHSHVAILLRHGIPMEEIQRRLGHSTIKTTIDIYASERLEAGRKSADVFDNLLREATP